MIQLLHLPLSLMDKPYIVDSDGYRDIQREVGGPFDIARLDIGGTEFDLYMLDEFGATPPEPNRWVALLFGAHVVTIRGIVLLGGGVDDEGNARSVPPLFAELFVELAHND